MKYKEDLITAGEFAKLARTTKRTITWYDEEGILHPKKINSKGYRYYSPLQILDFQIVMLLRNLGFSLPEIKRMQRSDKTLQNLFQQKREILGYQLKRIQKSLVDINKFNTNIREEGVLVKPSVKLVKPFEIYYIKRIGPYSKIYEYCLELKSYFKKLPNNAKYLTIFTANEYLPKKDNLIIGVVKYKGLKLNLDGANNVDVMQIPGFKALYYKHVGSPALISMIWSQMRKYMNIHNLKRDYSIPFFELEFYNKTALNDFFNEDFMESELNLPIA